MRKLFIFDLKDTLVRGSGRWCADCDAIIRTSKQLNSDMLLYSMNEPWTYRTLARYADSFAAFGRIVLTRQKQTTDIRALCAAYDTVGMAGDGPEERGVAEELGYPFLLVGPEGLVAAEFAAWAERLTV